MRIYKSHNFSVFSQIYILCLYIYNCFVKTTSSCFAKTLSYCVVCFFDSYPMWGVNNK